MNYKIHDFRECRNIIVDRSKMLGLDAPTKFQVTGDIPVIFFGDEDKPEV
jgi:hypothetical protein